MKVLIATPYFWPQVGGMENYARGLARGLSEAGCEVVVVCGDLSARQIVREEVDGYAIWRLPVWRVVSNTPVNLAWRRYLKRIIRTEQPDVINAHTPVPFMVDMVTWAAGRVPVVVTYHAATLIKPGSALMHVLIRGYLGLQFLTLARARAVIAVSPYVRERLAPWQGKTTVVANAVDAVGDVRDKVGAGLVFVSNLAPTHRWKGLDMILEALAIWQRNGLEASLTVVGDGADRPRYEQRVQELGLGSHVQFAGQLVGSDRDAVMREAAAVVLYPTTANDAFPTVMLEAWAQGVAVIAAAAGPLPSLVADGVTGLLVPPGSPTALAAALRDALGDPARLLALGEAGRQLVAREYTWPRQVARTLAVFEALTPAPKGTSAADIEVASTAL